MSSTGLAQTIHYDLPTSTGGTAPIQIACTPPSDSVFPIGAKTVSCTATDSKSQSAQCSFSVTLTAPPKLTLTNFIAFGDSMTAGEVVSEGFGGRFRTLMVDNSKSYPTDLSALLLARYTAQTGAIFVENDGSSGEKTADGLQRLPTKIDGGRFQVLLLMEGVNDFPGYQTALGNMQQMIEYAKRRGLRVFVATVPPQNPNPQPLCYPSDLGANAASVDPYNTALRSLASAENATLVDVNADFHGDVTTLIDCDGLHPTPAGYTQIAKSFLAAIQKNLEIPTTATLTSFFRRFP